MKKIILILIMSFMTLLVATQKTFALDPNDFDGFFTSYEVKEVYASNRPVNMSINYLETYLSLDVSDYTSYDFVIFDLSTLLTVQNLIIDSVIDNSVRRGTHLRLLNELGVELTKVFDIFNSNYLAQYTIPSGVHKIEIVATYYVDNPSMTEYQRLQQQSKVSGALNQKALAGASFITFYREGILMDANQFFDYLNSYLDNYKSNQEAIYNEYYNKGLNENRDLYGYYHDGVWWTAEAWGEYQYDKGYGKGIDTEIDWFRWSTTFFVMPFRILNIEILPGVRIGYFALFSLLLGVMGWFFFIVGKGRRK